MEGSKLMILECAVEALKNQSTKSANESLQYELLIYGVGTKDEINEFLKSIGKKPIRNTK